MIEIAGSRLGVGIVTRREPCLGEMRLIDIIGSTRTTILVGTQPGSSAFDSTLGHRRAMAKANMASCSLLSA
jgi:hypothetical protein